ncbi:MAG: PIN domain-containing protein, partial [Pseudomonadota bacterium]
ISELKDKESIPYETIELKNSKVIYEMRKFAVSNQAPFKEENDGGFKDAYIYFTIREYIQQNLDKEIYFVSDDKRLKQAVKQIKGIKCISKFDEFFDTHKSNFTDKYFLEKLKNETNQNITRNDIKQVYENINKNILLEVESKKFHYLFEIEKREIISFAERKSIDKLINELIYSPSFMDTHIAIEELGEYSQFLTDEDIKIIIDACMKNEQIFWIRYDDDVKEFILCLTEVKENILTDEQIKFINSLKSTEVENVI